MMFFLPIIPTTPAKAGVQGPIFPHVHQAKTWPWIPACAGIGGVNTNTEMPKI